MKTIKKLYDKVNDLGEGIHDKLHIIEQTDEFSVCENSKKFRVYHSDGYCFDVEKERQVEEEENLDDYYYI